MYEVAPAGARAQALLGALVAVIGGCRRAPQHAEIRAAVAPALAPPPVASSPPAVAETPALAPADTRVIEIALGAEFTCARTRGQTVHCWGENNHGQLGDGTTVDRASPARVPLSGVVELGAGSFHACARLTGGTVSCWGMALQGAGATARGESVVHPSTVVGLRGAERLAVGGTSACAFTAEGRVHCWGSFYEPYGNGFFEVPELRGAVHASLEQFFGCFQWQEEGEVRCWSDGYRYHLNGSPRVSKTNGPMTVAGLPSVRRVTTAFFSACAVTGGGQVYCWGRAGHLFAPEQIRPIRLPGLSGVTRIALGTTSLCALRGDGSVTCMGTNSKGELGDGTRAPSAKPRPVVGVYDAVDIAVGMEHACVVTRRGTVQCWGSNAKGQLGDGTRIDRPAAVEVRP